MKLVLDSQEIMKAVRRDLERQGINVIDVNMLWDVAKYVGTNKTRDAYVRLEAEVTSPPCA